MELMRKDSVYELVAVVHGTRRIGGIHPEYHNLSFVSKESPRYRDSKARVKNMPEAKYTELSQVISRYLEGT